MKKTTVVTLSLLSILALPELHAMQVVPKAILDEVRLSHEALDEMSEQFLSLETANLPASDCQDTIRAAHMYREQVQPWHWPTSAAKRARDGAAARLKALGKEVSVVDYEKPHYYGPAKQMNATVVHELRGKKLAAIEKTVPLIRAAQGEVDKIAAEIGNLNKDRAAGSEAAAELLLGTLERKEAKFKSAKLRLKALQADVAILMIGSERDGKTLAKTKEAITARIEAQEAASTRLAQLMQAWEELEGATKEEAKQEYLAHKAAKATVDAEVAGLRPELDQIMVMLGEKEAPEGMLYSMAVAPARALAAGWAAVWGSAQAGGDDAASDTEE